MKKLYAILTATLILNLVEAKTYTLASGKWTDAAIWSSAYPGTTIKADDVVVIEGQVTMNAGIVVEGMLQVEKGACMVGMKDLVISKSGKFVNNGNTVMKRIINEGTISNNLIMEAMNDIDNKGKIENNNNMLAGNNIENMGGSAAGNGGAYFANNSVLTSPSSSFGKDVNVFYGNQMADNNVTTATTQLQVETKVTANKITLSVINNAGVEVNLFRIEKSTDGKNYSMVQSIRGSKQGTVAMSYTDNETSNAPVYYRVHAMQNNGTVTTLPVTVVKAPVNAYTLANQ